MTKERFLIVDISRAGRHGPQNRTIGWAVSFSLLAAMLFVAEVRAQVFPEAEGYLGFSLYNNEYGTSRHNSPGIQFNLGYNVTRSLAILGDFGAQFHSTNIVWTNGKSAEADSYQFLFGPELRLRNRSKLTPFAHTLAGAALRNYAVPSGNWICSGFPPDCYQTTFSIARDFGFASSVGGGLDLQVHPGIALRVIQFDWIRTHLSRDNNNFSPQQGSLPVLGGWQDNCRISAGITFRLGEKGLPK